MPNTVFSISKNKKIAQILLERGLQWTLCDHICHDSEGWAGSFTFAISSRYVIMA